MEKPNKNFKDISSLNKGIKSQFNAFLALTKRHLLVFLKNPVKIVFTLMVPLSILLIYILFLRPMEIQQINQTLSSFDIDLNQMVASDVIGQVETPLYRKIYGIADNWMISGVLAVSCITVSLNCCDVMVTDKEKGTAKDFVSSPLSSSTIMLSYFLFNVIVTFLTNLLVYFICLIYLAGYGAYMITVSDFFLLIVVLFLSVASASLITFFICSFISSSSILGTFTAIFSAAIGFLIGAYLPSNMMPFDGIKYLTTFFPGTYSAGLFRNYFMTVPIEKLKSALLELGENTTVINELTEQFSFSIDFFDMEVPKEVMYLVLLAFIGIFLVLNILFSSKALLNLPKTMTKALKKQKKTVEAAFNKTDKEKKKLKLPEEINDEESSKHEN